MTSEDDPETPGEAAREELRRTKERLDEGTDRAVEEFDRGVSGLLSWLLDTETRARIYVYLRSDPASTSEEVADGTGLYPSTVREALAELHDEGIVERDKRDSDGAGNNPYEYEAIPPSELVRRLAGDVQAELNEVFNLDSRLADEEPDREPVEITVGGSDAAADRPEGEGPSDGDDGRGDDPADGA